MRLARLRTAKLRHNFLWWVHDWVQFASLHCETACRQLHELEEKSSLGDNLVVYQRVAPSNGNNPHVEVWMFWMVNMCSLGPDRKQMFNFSQPFSPKCKFVGVHIHCMPYLRGRTLTTQRIAHLPSIQKPQTFEIRPVYIVACRLPPIVVLWLYRPTSEWQLLPKHLASR